MQVPDVSTELCHAERSWTRVNKSSINLCAATIYKQKHKNTNQTTHAVNCHMHVIMPLCHKLNVRIAHTYEVQIFQFLDIDTAGSKQKHATH